MRCRTLTPLLLLTFTTACRDCEELGAAVPAGAIDPAVFNFGPITRGSDCTAALELTNVGGRTDLSVESASLKDTTGSWRTTNVPSLVRIGGSETIEIRYVAEGENGDVHAATLEVQTDDPDDGGLLRALVRATVTDAPAPAVETACGDGDARTSPCTSIDFGQQQVGGVGKILPVTVLNDGTADMVLSFAAVQGGDPAFEVLSVRRGSTTVELPVTIPPGRTGECGAQSDADNAVTIDIRYSPTATGANADTLAILTDAIDSPTVEIALTGVGTDVGILMNPDLVDFGELPEGETGSVAVTVLNIGTSVAPVNESCIDLEGDDTCDARCTGQPADTAFDGTLSCAVTTVAGGRSSLGFRLAPTDARPGGDDERIVTVTWTPKAGANAIPPTAVLALHSAILGDRIFTAPLKGGSIGQLDVAVTSDDACPGSGGSGGSGGFCIEATGDPADFTTWTGEITLRLTNVGSATLELASVELDGAPTIDDDYTLALPADTSLAVGESADLVVAYDEVAPGADAVASAQTTNIIVRHNGVGALTTIPLDVVPPQ